MTTDDDARKLVILVEDEPDHVELVRRAFAGDGRFGLAVASSLRSLDDLVTRVRPALVIADLVLPDGRGLDLLLRKELLADCPIVLITSQGDESVAVEAMKRGALDYVVKSAETLENMPHVAARALREWNHIVEREQAERERNRLEAQVLHAQKLESLGVLAGGIAHDFNNLLMAVLGHAELALGEVPAESPATRSIEKIRKASLQAADLCAQLLTYSGKGRLELKPFGLSELVRDVSRLLEVSISKSVVMKYDLADDLPPIEGDANQIQQVAMNLITNASEAIAGDDGVITVSTGTTEMTGESPPRAFGFGVPRTGTYVWFQVADNGSGMDEETKAKIFDPFFTTKLTGRGLGLAAVMGIARGHDGVVNVESERGRGTTVRVCFPASLQPVQPPGPEAEIDESWVGSGLILVVDDDDFARDAASRLLEERGFSTVEATNGREAVAIFREHSDRVAGVLLDMTMPRMGGERTVRELRRLRADVRIVLTSGHSEQEVLRRFGTDEPDGFLAKPYGKRELARAFRPLLAAEAATK